MIYLLYANILDIITEIDEISNSSASDFVFLECSLAFAYPDKPFAIIDMFIENLE